MTRGDEVSRYPLAVTGRCENCGRTMDAKHLMLSYNPWEKKEQVVCVDADKCAALAAAGAGEGETPA